VSGGLVISKIPQRTNWDLDSNIKYARTAEKVGFEYALSQIRFMAGYGAVSIPEFALTTIYAVVLS
jgi:alkanesulfonate monooxygenase